MQRFILTLVSVILVGSAVVYGQVVDEANPVSVEQEYIAPIPVISDLKLRSEVDKLVASTTLSTELAVKQKLEDANTKQITDLLKEIVDTLHNIERNGNIRK